MREQIFLGNGIEIEQDSGKIFLIYDAGEITDRYREIEISEREANEAMKGSMEAYYVILKHEKEGRWI